MCGIIQHELIKPFAFTFLQQERYIFVAGHIAATWEGRAPVPTDLDLVQANGSMQGAVAALTNLEYSEGNIQPPIHSQNGMVAFSGYSFHNYIYTDYRKLPTQDLLILVS